MPAAAAVTRRPPWARLTGFVIDVAMVVTLLGATFWVGTSLAGYERYVITGGSMSGSIEKGSVVFTRPTPVADLAVGDVITYLPPPDSGVTTLVTHRIVAVRTGPDHARVLRTAGDANDAVDPWRFRLVSDVQPVVAFHVPYVGHLMTAVADRTTRILVIGLPAALVALAALVQLGGALRGPRHAHTPARPGAGRPVTDHA